MFNPFTGMRYRTWSLFLVCNPAWLDERAQQRVEELFRQFELFGDVIGQRHLAVWFAPADERKEAQAWALDVSRNVDYCEKYGLLPSESPHIVTTTRNPDLEFDIGDFWQLALAGQSDRNIQMLLTKLADQILVQGLNQEALGSEEWWRSWYSILDHTIRGAGDIFSKVTLTVKTANFTVEARFDE